MSQRTLARFFALALSALCLLGVRAFAEGADATAIPQPGPAAVRTMTPLLASPQLQGKVLMTYYPGTRVQVVRQDSPGYVRVNVGERPGTLTGFMRADDLAFTEYGVRAVPGVHVSCASGGPTPVYAYPDERSEHLADAWDSTRRVLGVRADGWAHVSQGDGVPGQLTGFCFLGLTPRLSASPAPYAHTLPAEGEVRFEDALAYARRVLLEEARPGGDGSGEPVTAEGLDRCEPRIQAEWSPEAQRLWYHVEYHEPLHDYIYASLSLQIEGGEIVGHEYGSG